MKKVYIVTSGVYSDYRINAVFSTKALAEKYIEAQSRIGAFDWDAPEIEEYNLDILLNYPEGKNHYVVCLTLKSGTVISIVKQPPREDNINIHNIYRNYAGMEFFEISCWAKSEEQAKKIATDKRTKVLAERGELT